MNGAKILLVEDDPSLQLVVGDALERAGYDVEWIVDGRAALKRARSGDFALLVLDVMLPTLDGFEICRTLRREGSASQILMLTARGREEDRIRGLDLGADDYLVKPFALQELLARVRARLRGLGTPGADSVRIGEARVDFEAMTVTRAGEVVNMTRLEAGVLRLLIARRGKVVSRGAFLDEVWGYDRHPTTRTVDMHVARVRDKLGGVGGDAIHTVHGMGYRFDPPENVFEVAPES